MRRATDYLHRADESEDVDVRMNLRALALCWLPLSEFAQVQQAAAARTRAVALVSLAA
jgi:hypothetical protein